MSKLDEEELGLRLPFGCHIHTDDGVALYFGDKQGARFISFYNLHKGWQSHPKFWWNKRGWQYYQPAILTGELFTDSSTWHNLPKLLMPSRVVDVWRLRKKFWRDARRADREAQAKKEASND